MTSLVYRKLSKVEGSTQTINYTYTFGKASGRLAASLSNFGEDTGNGTAFVGNCTASLSQTPSPSAESPSHVKAGQELQAASCAETAC